MVTTENHINIILSQDLRQYVKLNLDRIYTIVEN